MPLPIRYLYLFVLVLALFVCLYWYMGYPLAALVTVVTTLLSVITAGGTLWNTFINHYTHSPAPVVYLKAIIAGKSDRDPPKDPRVIVRLHVEGGHLVVYNLQWESNGKKVKSIEHAINLRGIDPTLWCMSSESKSYYGRRGDEGHVIAGRGRGHFDLATFRPISNDQLLSREWSDDLRQLLYDAKLVLLIEYQLFYFFTQTVRLPLGRQREAQLDDDTEEDEHKLPRRSTRKRTSTSSYA